MRCYFTKLMDYHWFHIESNKKWIKRGIFQKKVFQTQLTSVLKPWQKLGVNVFYFFQKTLTEQNPHLCICWDYKNVNSFYLRCQSDNSFRPVPRLYRVLHHVTENTANQNTWKRIFNVITSNLPFARCTLSWTLCIFYGIEQHTTLSRGTPRKVISGSIFKSEVTVFHYADRP